eukprot:Tamp_21496.p3 GENE.Tamp_21496~~Tamp_21496.p3  ORF type:complete len:141 (-),score=8.78 Tamp_21496:108-530(-)
MGRETEGGREGEREERILVNTCNLLLRVRGERERRSGRGREGWGGSLDSTWNCLRVVKGNSVGQSEGEREGSIGGTLAHVWVYMYVQYTHTYTHTHTHTHRWEYPGIDVRNLLLQNHVIAAFRCQMCMCACTRTRVFVCV